MSAGEAAGKLAGRENLARAATIAAYALLGALLLGTRSVGLDRSYSHDEIDTLTNFVDKGPWGILVDAYRPNNHEFFSLLAWATTSVAGESELGLRFWSVVPFVAGVIVVVAWLHARIGVLPAILYLFLATLSPLLLDLTRQARGYGLAFLAMSVLVVAALEADRTASSWTISAVCAAGVVGTWTLPNFALAFVATGGVLLTNPRLRRRIAVGLAVSLIAIAVWYVPHVDDLLHSSQQEFGAPIPWFGLIVSPVEQVLAPAILWIEGPTLTTDLSRLPLVAALALVLVASPLLRLPRTAMILGSGVAVTLLVLWAARIYVSPRFVSYLLVPLFILAATGAAALMTHRGRSASLRVVLAASMLGLLVVAFASEAPPVLTLPREAHRDAIDVVGDGVSGTPVLAYTYHPSDLEFYLGRSVEPLVFRDVQSRVCDATTAVWYVTQPFGTRRVTLPCADRSGVRRRTLDQYARGGEIDVWYVPPRGSQVND